MRFSPEISKKIKEALGHFELQRFWKLCSRNPFRLTPTEPRVCVYPVMNHAPPTDKADRKHFLRLKNETRAKTLLQSKP